MRNPGPWERDTPVRSRQYSRRALAQRAAAIAMGAGAATVVPGTAFAQGTPVSATPSSAGTRSITREQYLAAVRHHFPLEEPRSRGGHMIMAGPGNLTLHPVIAADDYFFPIMANLYSALVRPSIIDGTWAPDLADVWELSDDGLVYTFHLNHHARWHDGQPVTAHDCVFTLDALLAEEGLSRRRSDAVRVVERYRALDQHTFELVGKRAIATLLDLSVGGLPIAPKHIWEPIPMGDWGAAPGATGLDPAQVVGSGPFRLEEQVSADRTTIVRNDNYFVPELVPTIDRFTLRSLGGQDAALLALRAGDVDLSLVPGAQVESLQASSPDLTLSVFDSTGWSSFIMNGDAARGSFFADAQVRQSMLYALDRDLVIETIANGFGVRADGIYAPPLPGYAPERVTTIYNHDPNRARSLLDVAGWIDADGDGVREKDGVIFRTEILYGEGGPNYRQIVTYLQQAWREIGLDIRPMAIPFPDLFEREASGAFDLLLLGMSPAPTDLGTVYRCDAVPPHGFNSARICNPEFDRLNELALYELDPGKRQELLVAQGNAANDIAHLGLLYFLKTIAAHHPRVRNFFPGPYTGMSWLSWAWLADGE